MSCPICHSAREVAFKARILEKYVVEYFFCQGCGLLQTEKPYWLDEAYSSAIAGSDTGLVQRNLYLSRVLSSLLFFLFEKNGKYLDVAGGYGLLTRLMRDYGFEYFWTDKYCTNLFAKGFGVSDTKPPFTALSLFEVLEHIDDPVSFLSGILTENGTKTVIFSTLLFEGVPPKPDEWWYYALKDGQHISFYQIKTLRRIARELGLNLYSNSTDLHMMTDKKPTEGIYRALTGPLSKLISLYVRKRMLSKITPAL